MSSNKSASSRPKIVGITGGIGSGKTTVAKMFAEFGAPVYYADAEAKELTATSPEIREDLIALLGAATFKDGVLDRKYMANKIFNDKELLAKANAIIHPRVAEHFKQWVEAQKFPYVLKEAAILFESGSYKDCDITILVTAPEEVRIQRVMKRDNTTRDEVVARMKNQWSDAKKRELADYIIENEYLFDTQKTVENLHPVLL
jgi:dephospho-CoA kinase